MKKEVVFLLLLGMLLILPLVSAQEQSQTYSGFNRFVDNIKLFFSSGDNKVMLALEIREKELNSAISNLKSGEEKKAKKEIESAIDMLKIIQSKTTPEIADEVRINIEETESKIKENENLNLEFFEKYLTEEQKTKLIIEYSEKIFEYCEELAKQDYELMLKDEKCKNNDFDWFKDEINNKIKEIQKQDFEEMKKQVEISMNNPKNSDCDEISLASERKRCEKFKALAIRCEFQDDESACKEIGMFKDVQTEERENYEREILNRYVPAECTEVGIRNGEECKKFIIALYQPDSECMENGEILDDEACGKKLVKEDKIPSECVKDGTPVSPEECENIMKEKSKISDDKIKVDLKECINAGYDTKKECGDFLLKQNLPQECIDAGALTPEACEKFKLPKKCQGQAYSNEECEAVFIKEKMPPECQESGTYNFFECAKILYARVSDISIEGEIPYLESKGINKKDIPNECFKDDKRTIFERDMDCDEALIKKFGIMLPPPVNTESIPIECMRDGIPVSPEECEEILNGRIIPINDLQDAIPKICQEANVSTPEECGRLLEKQRLEEGIGINMPKECVGKEVEKCKEIMENKGIDIEKPKIQEEICCKKTIAGEEPRYRWDYEEDCVSSEVQTAEVVSDDFCYETGNINEDIIIKKGVPEECAKLGVYDKESCSLIMSKINEERIKQGDKIVIDDEGNTDVITNDQINQIANTADKKSDEIKPDITKANEIKKEVEVMENNIKEIDNVAKTIDKKDSNNVVDKPQKTKDNEDVSPAPSIVDDDVAPGPQGIVGEGGSNSDSNGAIFESSGGGESVITGEVIGSGNKESFLGKIFKRIFGI